MNPSDLTHVALGQGAGARNISYRKGSSDERSINHVFERHDYNIRILQRWPEIEAFLNRQRAAGLRPLIIDAGANIGAASLYFALRFPDARVVAIEPEADNFRLLQKNTEGLDVRCVQSALASKSGYSKIVEAEGGYWAFRTELSQDANAGVRNITINEIFEEECKEGVYPFMIKMDIEGAEQDVFSGGLDWLDETPILIIELHDWIIPKAGTSKNFLSTIVQRERDFIVEIENVFSIKYEF